jgi:hypothetical protein
VTRLGLIATVGAATLVLVTSVGAVGPRLVVELRNPRAESPARIVLTSAFVSSLRVQAISPTNHVLRVPLKRANRRASGIFRFPIPGSWRLRAVDVASGGQVGATLRLTVRAVAPTAAPAGFGPVGHSGCTPPSPADASQKGFRDVFGTAIGEELWALPFVPQGASWARPDAAVFEGLVGKEIKIVFGMTAFHSPFRAVGPGGSIRVPVWGPSFHSGSNWDRQPGAEWGAGFVFPAAGCWRIQVGSRGDLWFLIRS